VGGLWLAESPIRSTCRRDLGIHGPLPGSSRPRLSTVSCAPIFLFPIRVFSSSTNRLPSHARWCFSSQPSDGSDACCLVPRPFALRRKRCFPGTALGAPLTASLALELALAQASARNPTHSAEPSLPRPHVSLNLDPIHHQSTPSTANPAQYDRGVVHPPLSGQSAQKW
jgi:hypothetical protein